MVWLLARSRNGTAGRSRPLTFRKPCNGHDGRVMGTLRLILTALGRDERGATAIEYGLLVALLAIAMIVGLGSAGTALNGVLDTAGDAMAG